MTNEEKARKIAADNTYDVDVYDDVKAAALEMAEWKDYQFDSMINHFYHLIQDGISYERAYKRVTGKDWQEK